MNVRVSSWQTVLSTCVPQEMRSSSPLPVGKVNQLHEAMAAYPDVKPRSMEWCLKLVDALFKSKRVKVYICPPRPPQLTPPPPSQGCLAFKALTKASRASFCKICCATKTVELMVPNDSVLGIADLGLKKQHKNLIVVACRSLGWCELCIQLCSIRPMHISYRICVTGSVKTCTSQ